MKVLVIEDAQEVVESIKLCLSIRWPECVILSTPNGKTGVKMLESESPDAVILDLALLDGYGWISSRKSGPSRIHLFSS